MAKCSGSVTVTVVSDGLTIWYQYAQNTSNTTAPISGWSSSMPSSVAGKFIWRREGYGLTASAVTSWGNVMCLTGATGSTGPKGDTGATAKSVSLSCGDMYWHYTGRGALTNPNQSIVLTTIPINITPSSYAWYRDNVLITGATGATYTVPSGTTGLVRVVADGTYPASVMVGSIQDGSGEGIYLGILASEPTSVPEGVSGTEAGANLIDGDYYVLVYDRTLAGTDSEGLAITFTIKDLVPYIRKGGAFVLPEAGSSDFSAIMGVAQQEILAKYSASVTTCSKYGVFDQLSSVSLVANNIVAKYIQTQRLTLLEGGSIESRDFKSGVSGFRLDYSGILEAVSALLRNVLITGNATIDGSDGLGILLKTQYGFDGQTVAIPAPTRYSLFNVFTHVSDHQTRKLNIDGGTDRHVMKTESLNIGTTWFQGKLVSYAHAKGSTTVERSLKVMRDNEHLIFGAVQYGTTRVVIRVNGTEKYNASHVDDANFYNSVALELTNLKANDVVTLWAHSEGLNSIGSLDCYIHLGQGSAVAMILDRATDTFEYSYLTGEYLTLSGYFVSPHYLVTNDGYDGDYSPVDDSDKLKIYTTLDNIYNAIGSDKTVSCNTSLSYYASYGSGTENYNYIKYITRSGSQLKFTRTDNSTYIVDGLPSTDYQGWKSLQGTVTFLSEIRCILTGKLLPVNGDTDIGSADNQYKNIHVKNGFMDNITGTVNASDHSLKVWGAVAN